ncbi:peptide chain release factor N(5)-glutamine methyltransferase [Anaerocolumna xylanovorans]|uniref:peptide chain release factor N(5)-glutamine methyltransferase n=1 Tax=Anaerocolumna xylanovorans TaxID=100134 RepID=UPI0009375E06
MTLQDALKSGREILTENKIDNGEHDAWLLLAFQFKISRAVYLAEPLKEITQKDYETYLDLIRKRSRHIPLQYITGEQEFMGLDFLVREGVLIPRQDTEILVMEALKVCKDKEVLDICTGSGCILLSLLKLGGVKQGTGVDISDEALEIACENAKRLRVTAEFRKSDIYSQVNKKYDIIISNPPYIPTGVITTLMEEVKDNEPTIALDGKEDGLYFYREICKRLKDYLNPGGYVFFEIGYDQGEAVKKLLTEAGMDDINIIKDLAGLNRVVTGRWNEKKGEPFT